MGEGFDLDGFLAMGSVLPRSGFVTDLRSSEAGRKMLMSVGCKCGFWKCGWRARLDNQRPVLQALAQSSVGTKSAVTRLPVGLHDLIPFRREGARRCKSVRSSSQNPCWLSATASARTVPRGDVGTSNLRSISPPIGLFRTRAWSPVLRNPDRRSGNGCQPPVRPLDDALTVRLFEGAPQLIYASQSRPSDCLRLLRQVRHAPNHWVSFFEDWGKGLSAIRSAADHSKTLRKPSGCMIQVAAKRRA
jgi:hypothetical protein